MAQLGWIDPEDSSFQGLGNLRSTSIFNIIYGCTDNGTNPNAIGVVNDADNDGLAALNYNPNANVDDGSCITIVYGCTISYANNYNSLANVDDGSCVIVGCMDPLYFEYDDTATVDSNPSSCVTLITYGCTDVTQIGIGDDNTMGLLYPQWTNGQYILGQLPCDGSQPGIADDCVPLANGTMQSGPNCCCIETIVGCTDSTAQNYDINANYQPHPGSDLECFGAAVFGCTDPTALNYNPNATQDDGSCLLLGCTDPTAFNYDANATMDDGSCIAVVLGCIDATALNFDPNAYVDNGSCIAAVYGCTDPTAFNYDASANTDDNSCVPFVSGCTDSTAFNYNPQANTDDGSCIPVVLGCTNPVATNYDASANVDDGSCLGVVLGCTDNTMYNYDPLANVDDGSCVPFVYGCTDPTMFNYDAAANTDDGSCVPVVLGCTDPNATNYDPLANSNDGSCIAAVIGCTDSNAVNYNSSANTPCNSSNSSSCLGSITEDNCCCEYVVGDRAWGGIIFYLDGNGGGLVVAEFDILSGAGISQTLDWGCAGTNIPGAYGLLIGDGEQNTIDIDNGCADTGIDCAADYILDTINGGSGYPTFANTTAYFDWFLPSKEELQTIYDIVGPGGSGTNTAGENIYNIAQLNSASYWSSSEHNASLAWVFLRTSNQWVKYNKDSGISVRIVRAF